MAENEGSPECQGDISKKNRGGILQGLADTEGKKAFLGNGSNQKETEGTRGEEEPSPAEEKCFKTGLAHREKSARKRKKRGKTSYNTHRKMGEKKERECRC